MKRGIPAVATYGPWALVAGASEGLGAAFGDALASRGFSLVLVARRESVLDEVAHRIKESYGCGVRTVVCDLSREAAAEEIIARCADIDVGLLVYNAAYAPRGEYPSLELAGLRKAVAVNVRGPVDLIHAFLPRFAARGNRSGIILMSSLAGDQGSPRITIYSATKAFTTVLAQGLSYELAPLGVDVTSCVAGAIRTPGLARAHTGNREAPGTLDASKVAATALSALGRKTLVVPGMVNRLARFAMRRLLPTRAAIAMMALSTRILRAEAAERAGAGPVKRKEPRNE